MRVAIYTRVSSRDQVENYSLAAQRQVCEQFVEGRGWDVVHVYEEPGRSGKSVVRPAFQQMMADANAKRFDVVVVHKLDRFSRSVLDTMVYLSKLHESNISFVSATEQFDFTDPMGKMMMTMLAAFAQWYLDNLAAEIKKGKQERFRQGDWNGPLSFGYTTPERLRSRLEALGNDYRRGKVSEEVYSIQADLIEDQLERYAHLHDTAALPCPFDGAGVVLAYRKYATMEYSDKEIAELLNEQGFVVVRGKRVNPFSTSTVRDMLSNRFYLGEVSWSSGRKGRASKRDRTWQAGNHDALISQELYEKAQYVRQVRAQRYYRRQPSKKHYYPFSHLIVDQCGVRWRGNWTNGRRIYRQRMEREKLKSCKSTVKSVHADKIEDHIFDVLKQLRIPDDWLENIQQQQQQSVTMVKDHKSITARLDRAKKLFVMGDLTEGEYTELRDELRDQLKDQVVTIEPPTVEEATVVAGVFQNIGYVWNVATDEERTELARMLFERIEIENGVVKTIMLTRIASALVFGTQSVSPDGEDRIRTCGPTCGRTTA